jgi:hypothetical protein
MSHRPGAPEAANRELNRDRYGPCSERTARLPDQLGMGLEASADGG